MVPVSTVTASDMVGRDRELQALRQAQEVSLRGVPQGALILGEAGIGKSRLLAELVATLPEDVLVARGQCVARGSLAPPLAPVREIVRDLRSGVGAAMFAQAAGRAAEVLASLLPELAQELPTDRSGGDQLLQDQLYDAVIALLEAVSDQAPLVLLVEDVHWADEPTLDILRAFLRLLRRGRVLVVLTCRSEEVTPGESLSDFLQDVGRGRSVTRLDLRRLVPTEVARQVELLVGGTVDVDEQAVLVRRSDGVPFLVEELVALRDRSPGLLPPSLRELLLDRYWHLGPGARAVVRLLAAGGVRVEHDLVVQAYEGSLGDLDAAVREAVAARVITTEGTSYVFRHALTHEAVHGELLPAELTRLHSRFAAALEAGPCQVGRAAEIAHHRLAAHELAKAFDALILARREASAGGAPLSAGALGTQALGLWQRVPEAGTLAGCTRAQLARDVASDFYVAGDRRAFGVLGAELDAVSHGDPAGRALLLHELAAQRHGYGLSGGVELCEEALALLAGVQDEPGRFVRARVLGGLGFSLSFCMDPAGHRVMERAVAEARALMEQTSDPGLRERAHLELVRSLTNLATDRTDRRDVDSTLGALTEARRLAGTDAAELLRVDERVVALLLHAGHYARCRDAAAAAWELATSHGMQRGLGAQMMLMRAAAEMALGDLVAAEADLGRARSVLPRGVDRAMLDAGEMELRLTTGDLERAQARYAEARARIGEARAGDPVDDLVLSRVVGWLHLLLGDPATVWGEVQALWRHGGTPVGVSYPLIALGAAALATLRRAGTTPPGLSSRDAERRLRHTLDQVAVWDHAGAWRTMVDAELSGEEGTGTDAGSWQAAVSAAAGGRLPLYLHVYALRRLGEAQLSAGDRTGAAESLATAREMAGRAGLGGLVRAVDELARRARLPRHGGRWVADPGGPGVPTAAGIVPGEAPLTAREREVLELVAQGLSNRQIGATLFISSKTVSVHVSAILRKVGATSRAQAAGLATTVLSQEAVRADT